MKSVGIVLPDLAPASLKDFYLKKNAKRYYSDLNVQVYYFKSHSTFWVNWLRKLDMPLVALNQEVSQRLGSFGIPHIKFNNANSVHELLISLN